MKEVLPNIQYRSSQSLDVEVKDFSQLFPKLINQEDHNPFNFHRIQFFLILIVKGKSFKHFVDFKSYKLKKGSILFIAQNQVHKFSNEIFKSAGVVIIFNKSYFDNISIKSKLLNLFNTYNENCLLEKGDYSEENLIAIAEMMLQEYDLNHNHSRSDIIASLLHVFLLKAERSRSLSYLDNVNPKLLKTFSEFRELLEHEFTYSRSSRYYASKIFTSYKSLNDVVKQFSGKTAKVYIDDFVTLEIKRFLTATSYSVKEIAYRTGFDEPSNMVNFFKKQTGQSPLKFRQAQA